MRKIRIIPRLDIKGPNVVKGIHCEGLRVVGNPIEFAKKYYLDGADELLCMDIVASLYQRNFDFDLLKAMAKEVFMPITAGGGIRSINDINNILRAGADKVAINTYAIKNPAFVTEASRRFGSQCIVTSIEAKKIGNNKWEAYIDGGRERTGIDAVQWAKRAINLGAGEILITSIDNDGVKNGYDIELTKTISRFSTIPVIVHGGAENINSFSKILKECRVEGLSAASVFHYNELTIRDVKKSLLNKFPVRI